jgi:predicted secreted Zn-dependent protease
MGYQTTIIDAERVLGPRSRNNAKKLLRQRLSRFAGDVERVIFRVNTFIGDDFRRNYLVRVVVKLTSGKRIIHDTTCQNFRAGVQDLVDEISNAVAQASSSESGTSASNWTRLARQIRAPFEYALFIRRKAMT